MIEKLKEEKNLNVRNFNNALKLTSFSKHLQDTVEM